jgi:hypothetical protein
MNDDILKMFSRIKLSQDGLDFIEYLKTLSQDNYEAFKRDETAANDIHKGYAIAIDSLLGVFSNCEATLKVREYVKEDEQWT